MHGQAITVYRNDIETNLGARGDDLRIVGRQLPQAAAFTGVDGAECRPKSPAVPALDFDEDQDRAVERHEVYLAAGDADVASEDPVSV